MGFLNTLLLLVLFIPASDIRTQPGIVDGMLLARGSFLYKGEFGPPSMAAPFGIELIVRDDTSSVRVIETAQLPGGRQAVEDMTLDPSSLAVKTRAIRMDDMAFELTFLADGVRGTATAKGERKPVEFPLTEALFADGGGAFATLGAVRLKDGLQFSFYNLDLSRRTTSVHHALVTGPEPVSVEAGQFQAFRIELTSDPAGRARPIHVWIDAPSRVLIKVASETSRYELISRP